MATYTTNGGIKKIATGDESGTWGTSTNTNFDIIDRLAVGVGSISLSGTTHTLTTSEGAASDGQYHVLVLGGSPSGTNTITVSPNDAARLYVVKNNSGQTATFTQGSGANVSVSNGKSAIIYCDGAGSGAAVVDITATFDTLTNLGITASAAELNYNDITTLGTVQASKVVTADSNGDVLWTNGDKATFGTGGDFSIYNDGSNTYLADNGDGNIILDTINGTAIQLKAGTDQMLTATKDGAVTLYYDNSSKVTTTTSGAVIGGGVTGEIQLPTTDYLIRGGATYGDIRIDAPRIRFYESGNIALAVDGQDTLFYDTAGNADLRWDASASAMAFADNSKANFGNAGDLQIYHDGSHSYISEGGTGSLYVRGNGEVFIQSHSTNENMIRCVSNAEVELYHNNSVKLETTSTGVDITGSLTTDGLTSDGSVDVNGTLEIEEVSEKVTTITSTSGTITFDTASQAVIYATANQTANRTINFTNVNSRITTGQSCTCSILMTQGSTAYYLSSYQVDGSAVTPKWSGGSAPSAGNASGIDVYTFTIIKTASATFTVLASVTQYA